MSAAEPWLRYATTDPQVLGCLAWIGLLVTIAGFWIAITQLRKVKKASAAANDAVTRLARVTRAQEHRARIISALDHMTSAQMLMRQNQEAAAAHLSVSWSALVAARELTDTPSDNERIEEYVVATRQLLDDITAPDNVLPTEIDIAIQRHYAISRVLDGLGTMSARLNAILSNAGTLP